MLNVQDTSAAHIHSRCFHGGLATFLGGPRDTLQTCDNTSYAGIKDIVFHPHCSTNRFCCIKWFNEKYKGFAFFQQAFLWYCSCNSFNPQSFVTLRHFLKWDKPLFLATISTTFWASMMPVSMPILPPVQTQVDKFLVEEMAWRPLIFHNAIGMIQCSHNIYTK